MYSPEHLTPNTAMALRILLTLPVSVAAGEHSFSKLKLLKNYLRSTMSQNCLSGLALISVESSIAKNLDFTELSIRLRKYKNQKNSVHINSFNLRDTGRTGRHFSLQCIVEPKLFVIVILLKLNEYTSRKLFYFTNYKFSVFIFKIF
ncbi:unnamed protein product [Eretmochelys imbricata]